MREAPFAKPYYNLAEQAQKSYPGNKPENVAARTQLARKLRKGFHALTLLIRQVNQDIALNTGTNRLKAELELSTLGIFILWDLLGRTARKAAAYIEEYKTDDSGKESERQAMLSELADCADMSFAEQSSDRLPPRTGSRTHFSSLIECWFQKFMMLLVDDYA